MPDETTTAVDQVVTQRGGTILVRKVIRTLRDGVEISKIYHRHVVVPGDDYSNEDAAVRSAAAAAHTPEVIAAYQEEQAASKAAAGG